MRHIILNSHHPISEIFRHCIARNIVCEYANGLTVYGIHYSE